MKIGILTLPIAENYGGILQAVALSQYLTQEGHDVTLIYKKTQPILWKEIAKKILLMIPFHNLFNIKTRKNIQNEIAKRTQLHKIFIDNEILRISPALTTTAELTSYSQQQGFDAIIVGSDQVWRKSYINDPYYLAYFLNFVTNDSTKKIAYAASFGNNQWEGIDDESEISTLLKKFSGVSVRESSGKNICKNTFSINNSTHVLDPTLLMTKQFYLDLIHKYDLPKTSQKKLATYVLDESNNKKNIIQHYQKSLNISDNETVHLKGFSQTTDACTIPEWLFSIANAEFVITDSFHGMVFSIIFEKNFIVIANEDRGLDRFTSLLSCLNLEERLIKENNINYSSIDHIDFSKVAKTLQSARTHSTNFLRSSLQHEKIISK